MVGVFKASYAVTDFNLVVPLVRPGAFVDLLTDVLHCLRGGPDRSRRARRTSSPMMAATPRAP